MTSYVYTIVDLEARHFYQPFIASDDADAKAFYVRNVEPGSSLWDYGDTFALYRLATIDCADSIDTYTVERSFDFIDTFDHILGPIKARFQAYRDIMNGGRGDETCEENT